MELEYFYIYNTNTKETKRYIDLEDFLYEIIDEDYLEQLLNECYEEVRLPGLGYVGVGTILKQFNALMDCQDDEIMIIKEDLLWQIDTDEVAIFNDYVISDNEQTIIDKLKREQQKKEQKERKMRIIEELSDFGGV